MSAPIVVFKTALIIVFFFWFVALTFELLGKFYGWDLTEGMSGHAYTYIFDKIDDVAVWYVPVWQYLWSRRYLMPIAVMWFILFFPGFVFYVLVDCFLVLTRIIYPIIRAQIRRGVEVTSDAGHAGLRTLHLVPERGGETPPPPAPHYEEPVFINAGH